MVEKQLCTIAVMLVVWQAARTQPLFLPQSDSMAAGISYELHVGETYEYFAPANGWFADTIGPHHHMYHNIYFNGIRKDRSVVNKGFRFVYYHQGKRANGKLTHLQTNAYFDATMRKGYAHGHVVWYNYSVQPTDAKPIAEGEMRNGEVVGDWTFYDVETGAVKARCNYRLGQELPATYMAYTAGVLQRKCEWASDTLMQREYRFAANGDSLLACELVSSHPKKYRCVEWNPETGKKIVRMRRWKNGRLED